MPSIGNPRVQTRVDRDTDAQIRQRIARAIAKSTRGARDEAEFVRRAVLQYLAKLERSARPRGLTSSAELGQPNYVVDNGGYTTVELGPVEADGGAS
jgi:hypothetical protein